MKYVAYGASTLSIGLLLFAAVHVLSFFWSFDVGVVHAQEESLGIAEVVGLGEVFSACGSLNFVPSSINITSNPPYAIGQPMTFWAFTTNVGDQTVTNTSDNMWQRFCMDNGNCYTSNSGVVSDSQGAGDRIMEVGQTLPSGDVSDSIVRTWTPTQAKNYTIYFCTDTNQGVPEYNENDNCSERTFTVGSNLQPDYIPSGITMSPTNNLVAGQTITFSGFTTNAGNTAGGDAWQRFCLSSTTGNGNPPTLDCHNSNAGIVGAGSRLRSNGTGLAAGAVSDPIERPWIATEGRHTVYLCTDTAHQVAESNENNNCSTRTFTVGAGNLPDLTVVNLARTSGTIAVGQQVSFTGNVRNSGTGNAAATNARFCINNNNCLNSTTGRVGSDVSVSSLTAGQTSSQVSTNWTAVGGTHTVYLCADVGKSVGESNEDNNCAQLGQFTVAAAMPDLISVLQTRSGTLAPDGTSFLANNPMTFTGYVYNYSSVTAGSSRTRMCINNTNCFNSSTGRLDADENISSLGPNGMSPTMSRSWTPTTPGTYTLTMCADINPAQVSESDEGNNCASTNFVIAAAQPDLVVQNLSRTPANDVSTGQSVTFSGRVVNTGSSGAGASSARFCIGTIALDCLNSTTGRIGSDISVSPLQAGQASPLLSVNWTAVSGTQRLYMCADVGKIVTESNEGNNCAQLAQFTVADAQPDLRPINLSRTSGTINAGQNVVFTGNIRNDGSLNAAATDARFCLSSTTGSSPATLNCLTSTNGMLSEQGISALAAGQTSSQLSTNWTATQGTHRLYLCADVDQEVTESNEGNNCAQLSNFTVGAGAQPDIVAGNTAPAANATFSSEATSITFTGTAQNSSSINVSEAGWADVEIDWGSDNVAIGSYNAFNSDKLGSMSAGQSKSLSYSYSGTLPIGTHRYRFNVDVANEVDESNESNNRSAWRTFTVSASVPVTAPPEITANPGLVDYGGTSQISWDLNGHIGCWITAANNDSHNNSSAGNPLASDGSFTTDPIVGETLYTIQCPDDGSSDEATVRVRPILEEI